MKISRSLAGLRILIEVCIPRDDTLRVMHCALMVSLAVLYSSGDHVLTFVCCLRPSISEQSLEEDIHHVSFFMLLMILLVSNPFTLLFYRGEIYM